MKKHIGIKIGIIIAALFLIGASKPSLDGRALVASPGELPPGLYVKAAAFLPGDTVLITNPAAKVSVEALVFGTFSPSEGVAVVLSPEAADVLLITKGSNSIVQLTKSGGDTERSVLAKAFDKASQSLSAEKADDDSVLYEDYVKSETRREETLSPEAENIPESAVFAPLSEKTSEPRHIPESVPVPVSESLIAEEPDISPDQEGMQTASDVQEIDNAGVSQSAVQSEEETVFTPFADIAASETESDTVLPEKAAAEPAVEIAEDTGITEPLAQPESDTADKSEMIETAAEIAVESEITEAPEETAASALSEELPQNIDSSEAVYDEPNVLIAAEDNPPVFEERDEQEAVKTDSAEHSVLPDYFTSSQEDDSSFIEKPLYTGNVDFDTDSYLIDSLAAFGKGNYCIQLATYKNRTYIAEVLEKYAEKYPVRLLKSEKIPEAYQVLIGPLNKDEYPVVLKRFVSRGFKEAFVRTVR